MRRARTGTRQRPELERIGRDVERVVLARAGGWRVEVRVLVYKNRTVVF